MGRFKVKVSLFAVAGGFAISGLSGCNDTAFQVASPAALAQVNPLCTVGTTKANLRVFFMLDDSGSTATTDPKKAMRTQTLQQFIKDYGANTNLTYSFAYFSGTTAHVFDVVTSKFVTGNAPNAIGPSSALSTALLDYEALAPGGNTPYKAAFSSMTTTIAADEAAGNKQDYVVVFMSDGQPTDISGTANLEGLVPSLKTAASANGSVLTLSTVYFGDETDSTSIANLTNMAKAGGGQTVDTNKLAAGGLVINDILNVPGGVCL